MIKVLHYVAVMNRAGEETFIMNLFRKMNRNEVMFDFLCSLDERGDYDEEILSLGGIVRHIQLNRIKGPIKQIDNAVLLYIYLRKLKREYEAFHIHTQHAMDAFLSSMAAKCAGFNKVIVHSHSTNTLFHKKAHFLFRPLLRILPITKFACSELAGKWMYGKQNFKIVCNGIDTEIFTYDEEVRYKVREKNGWQDRFVVGHVGSFTYPKNHEFLIDIFEELVNRIPNAILVLVGKGPLQKKIEKKVSDKNLADSVVFLGNRSDIAELNQAMDIFVFPSHYEGLPVTLIEAQATGLPCIISDTVTNEVYITDRIQKCSLKSAAFVWAEQIKNTNLTKEKRTAYSYEISVSGYDMAKVAQNLKKFYCS